MGSPGVYICNWQLNNRVSGIISLDISPPGHFPPNPNHKPNSNPNLLTSFTNSNPTDSNLTPLLTLTLTEQGMGGMFEGGIVQGEMFVSQIAVHCYAILCICVVDVTVEAAVAVPKPASNEFVVETSPLSDIRQPRVNVSDIAFDADGSVLVATSDGLITTPVQCYRVELQRRTDGSDACHISCTAVAGFFLRCHTESTAALELTATRVTHVRFVKCDAGFALLVCAGCLTGSHVELWQLGSQFIPLHRFYQPPDAASPVTVQVGY